MIAGAEHVTARRYGGTDDGASNALTDESAPPPGLSSRQSTKEESNVGFRDMRSRTAKVEPFLAGA